MATSTRSGIPTIYRATRFRSRLEARWAAFFDLVDWSWVYEPFDSPGYIPDFLIQGIGGSRGTPLLVEVGPCETEADFRAKSAKAATIDRPVLVLGVSPFSLDDGGFPGAGWLTTDEWGMAAGAARWSDCRICAEIGVILPYGSFTHRPCGHHEEPDWVARDRLLDLWARAGNQTQWRP